jgi:dipeptidyl aminopeptidase/acylaminoacyl peptidase
MPQFNHHRIFMLSLWMALSLAAHTAVAERVERDGLIFDGVPAADAALAERLLRYQPGRGARFMDWLADGSLLIAARVGDTEQLQRVSGPMRAREQLSFFGEALRGASAQAFQNTSLAVVKDTAGGAALYLLALDDHHERTLVEAVAQTGQALWAHDGHRVAYSSRQRTGRDADLYVIDSAAGGLPQLIASGGGDWQVLDWSLDDRSLLALRHAPDSGDQLLRIDLASLAMQPLAAGVRQARFGADGRSVIYLGDQDSEFARLLQLPAAGSSASVLTLRMNHDIEQFDISADGRFLAYTYNDGGYSRVTLVDQRAGLGKIVTALPSGVISALRFDRAGTQLAINIESATAPADVYVLDVASGATTRWTESELGPLSPAGLSVPQPIRFSTWDRSGGRARTLSALVYRPSALAAPAAQRPVLVLLPGGDGAVRGRFDLQLQSLVNELGLVVIVPAVRGSAGLGRSFVELGAGALRDDAVRDVGSLLVWIGTQPDMDRSRVAVMGSGPAAWLALAATARFGERLQAAIFIDGVADGVQLQAIGRPVLIVRGVEMPPTLEALAEQLMWRLRATGNDAWLLATSATRPSVLGAAQQPELTRVIAQFLSSKNSARLTPAAGDSPAR